MLQGEENQKNITVKKYFGDIFLLFLVAFLGFFVKNVIPRDIFQSSSPSVKVYVSMLSPKCPLTP